MGPSLGLPALRHTIPLRSKFFDLAQIHLASVGHFACFARLTHSAISLRFSCDSGHFVWDESYRETGLVGRHQLIRLKRNAAALDNVFIFLNVEFSQFTGAHVVDEPVDFEASLGNSVDHDRILE